VRSLELSPVVPDTAISTSWLMRWEQTSRTRQMEGRGVLAVIALSAGLLNKRG
jgi:hypothetical protein